ETARQTARTLSTIRANAVVLVLLPHPSLGKATTARVRPLKDLFADQQADNFDRVRPLAARMRPASLEEFIGQRHLVGEGELLWRLLKARKLGSVLFYGPPGTGKTTLARLLADHLSYEFRQLS